MCNYSRTESRPGNAYMQGNEAGYLYIILTNTSF